MDYLMLRAGCGEERREQDEARRRALCPAGPQLLALGMRARCDARREHANTPTDTPSLALRSSGDMAVKVKTVSVQSPHLSVLVRTRPGALAIGYLTAVTGAAQPMEPAGYVPGAAPFARLFVAAQVQVSG